MLAFTPPLSSKLDGERFTFNVRYSLLLRLPLDGPAFDRHDGENPCEDEANQSNSLRPNEIISLGRAGSETHILTQHRKAKPSSYACRIAA